MSHSITQWRHDPGSAALHESLFAVGNGHFGIRGAEEEARHAAFRGTLVNGFFDKKPIRYGEWAYGYARNHETILNVADIASIELAVDGAALDLCAEGLEAYSRRLELDRGWLERDLEWRAPSGAAIRARSWRLASFERPQIAAMRYEVTALSACRIAIRSLLDGSVRNRASEEGDPRVGSHLDTEALRWLKAGPANGRLSLSGLTSRSGLGIAVIAAHLPSWPGEEGRPRLAPTDGSEGECLWSHWELDLGEGEAFRIDKLVSIVDGKAGGGDGLRALEAAAERALDDACTAGFAAVAAEQEAHLARFWAGASIEVEGDPSAEEGLRFSIFHLYQSAGRDGRTNLAAKGVTGEGYEGHYFWDTEIFGLPFFTYEAPGIARSLVDFRIATLGKARERAAELALPGALFPWRTIDGEETSAYYPAGTAQFHIDADVAFALLRYQRSSADQAIMAEGGTELLVETARLWMGLGFHNPRRGGAFCIPCVTGPDEYTALVDNNAYTNLMAELNLREAAKAVVGLKASDPAAHGALAGRLALTEEEVAAWLRAADAMYLPHDGALGIIPQDDAFMDRPTWDLEGTPPGDFPLLLHHHPLMLYRHRVLKQPDTVLALLLRHDRFGLAEKRRNFLFYEPITTGDSSLSHSIQSVMAAECGMVDKAMEYFRMTARMDLDDVHANTKDGVHIAAMAGSWISVVYGFAGMRETVAGLSFSPSLPPSWTRLAFSLAYRGSRLACEYRHGRSRYSLMEGPPVDILHEGRPYRVVPGGGVEVDESPRPLAWIFDLDGVIADTARLHLQAWERLAAGLGLPFDPAIEAKLKGVSRMDSLRIVLGPAAASLDAPALAGLGERKNAHYLELLRGLGPADILPGMASLLEGLKASGARLALASASRNAPEVLRRLGLAGSFDAVVDASSVAMAKPDPELFLRAAELLGTRRRDCIAVEDAQSGVDAIKAAGMFAVAIGRGIDGADLVFPDTLSLERVAVEAAFLSRAKRP
jgi:alpha,alpha-trehalose phosphorylase